MKKFRNIIVLLFLAVVVFAGSFSSGIKLLSEQTYGNTRDTMTCSNTTIQSLTFTNERYKDVWFMAYSSLTGQWVTYHLAFDMTYVNDIRINYKGAVDSTAEVQGKIGGTYFPLPLQTGTTGSQVNLISWTGGGTRWVSFVGTN